MSKIIPIIDLFAGPGGLGEGFSAFQGSKKQIFKIKLSIEMDESAHQTLLLRSFFRQFSRNTVPEEYYQYLRKEITREKLFEFFKAEANQARREALRAELGSTKFPHKLADKYISAALGRPKPKKWLLIGGPPCQAYSLVGRARRTRDEDFEEDPKHFLYKEYLRIIAKHKPPVFVMENVKGLLSAKVNGENIFQKIISDLTKPATAVYRRKKIASTISKACQYNIYSLVNQAEDPNQVHPSDFIIQSENHGIPQARHRVILIGVRSDLKIIPDVMRKCAKPVKMWNVLCDLPQLRSTISRNEDSIVLWRNAIASIATREWFFDLQDETLRKIMERSIEIIKKKSLKPGDVYHLCKVSPRFKPRWYHDPKIKGVCNHVARGHMIDDIHRYFYAACFSQRYKRSPQMADFPEALLPKHANVQEAVEGHMFSDRFRVQLRNRPSTTVTSHISKDGHYFIHPDPTQCRSLTVREAARLQTFPDNYFFEGARTEQYRQIGNAVPPLLAVKIADIIYSLFQKSKIRK